MISGMLWMVVFLDYTLARINLQQIIFSAKTDLYDRIELWTDVPISTMLVHGLQPEVVTGAVTRETLTIHNRTDMRVFLVSCSSDALWWYGPAPVCYCYHQAARESTQQMPQYAVTEYCDASVKRLTFLYSWVEQIIIQGRWHQALVIRDYSTYYESSGRENIMFSCADHIEDITDVINDLRHQWDYYNILVHCKLTDTINLVQQIGRGRSKWLNINWLMVNIAQTDSSVIQPHLKEGDNMLTLTSSLMEISLNSFMKEVSRGHLPALLYISAYWCSIDCRTASLAEIDLYERQSSLAELLPQTFHSFHGKHLIVSWGEYVPFCFTVDGGLQQGVEVEIVKSLAEKFDFNFTLVKSLDDGWGSETDDGTWNGMIGMVMRGEADLAISGISMLAAREAVIDFLYPHFEDPSVVMIYLQTFKYNYFSKPFQLTVWLAYGSLPLLIAVCLTGIRSHSSRVILAAFWLTVIIVSAVYTGNLTATLAVSDRKLPFSTLEGLAHADGYKLMIVDGSSQMQLFKDGRTEVYKELWSKSQLVDAGAFENGKDPTLDALFSGGQYAVAGDLVDFENYRLDTSCHKCTNLVTLPEHYNKIGMGIVVRKGVPYRRRFSEVIMRLIEGGMVKYWTEKYLSHIRNHNDPAARPVSLQDVYYVCVYVFLLGLIAAGAVLVLELLSSRLKQLLLLKQL